MIWLIAIICIILVVVYWRIFIPLTVIAAVLFGLLLLYLQGENDRSEHKRKLAEQTVRQRIANAKATAGDIVRQWEVFFDIDPASGEKVPRNASVLSDDALCRLQIEQRIDRSKLAGIYCSGLKISSYSDIEVKFDNRPTSDTMGIQRFSDGDDVYISSHQYAPSGHLSYDELLRRMTGANKVALLLTVEGAGKHWITFSLTGSTPALTKIGAIESSTVPKGPIANATAKAAVNENSESSKSTKLAKQEARAAGTYEITRPSRVYAAPSELSQLIGKIEPGVKVKVVNTRDGWLEIHSKHGRPLGFIRREDATRVAGRN